MAGRPRWRKADMTGRQGSAICEMRGLDIPPILILHGEKDEKVPLTQAVAFRRGCQFYGAPFEMAVYPREGHLIRERAHLIDMLKGVRRFCDVMILRLRRVDKWKTIPTTVHHDLAQSVFARISRMFEMILKISAAQS